MNPDRHASSHYDYFKDLIKGDNSSAEAHRKFYDEYNAVLDMDADYYLETIQTVFQDFKLVYGTWDVKGVNGKMERVRPQDIQTTALMTVEGELDDISGSGQTRAAHDLCSGISKSEQHHVEVIGAGHYGIFSGRRWRDVVYPQVKTFILKHQPTPGMPAAVDTPTAAAADEVPAPLVSPPALSQPQATARPAERKATTRRNKTVAPAVVHTPGAPATSWAPRPNTLAAAEATTVPHEYPAAPTTDATGVAAASESDVAPQSADQAPDAA
jgi:poly(3-hydroxybutyrate) depolymerase